ncbi:hypothetical protein D9M68_803160 [compost metagenome]
MQAGLAGALDQRLHQGGPQALAALVAAHIDRMLHGMAETFDAAPGAVAGVAEHLALRVQRHQHREAGGRAFGQPGAAVGQVHQGFVPDRRGVLHSVVVDGQDAVQVRLGGVANQMGHGGPRSTGDADSKWLPGRVLPWPPCSRPGSSPAFGGLVEGRQAWLVWARWKSHTWISTLRGDFRLRL